MVEVILFTTSTQSLDTSMRTWMWGWSLSSNWAQDSFWIEWVANAKFVFRGSCEASGWLFRIKNLKFFRKFFFFKIQATAHTLLQPFCWLNQIIHTYFFLLQATLHFLLFEYSSSASFSSPLSAHSFSGRTDRFDVYRLL